MEQHVIDRLVQLYSSRSTLISIPLYLTPKMMLTIEQMLHARFGFEVVDDDSDGATNVPVNPLN